MRYFHMIGRIHAERRQPRLELSRHRRQRGDADIGEDLGIALRFEDQLMRIEHPMPAIIRRPEDAAADIVRELRQRVVRAGIAGIAIVGKDVELDHARGIDVRGHRPRREGSALVHWDSICCFDRRALIQRVSPSQQILPSAKRWGGGPA
jgi:hypothetical protein